MILDRLTKLARRAIRSARYRMGIRPQVPVFGRGTLLASTSFKPESELGRIFTSHDGRIIHKWSHYFEIYERHFAPYRTAALAEGKPLRLLEIGVGRGGSLEMWRRYFGPDAIIGGLEINPGAKEMEADGFLIEIGSQTDPAALERLVDRLGGIDIVVDDGGHRAHQQIGSFETLFPLLSAHGLYCCEDLHAAYWPDFEGGLKRPGTFIELTKDLIDRLHAWYLEPGAINDPFAIKDTVFAIHTYDSIVVIEKRPRERPMDIMTKAPAETVWPSHSSPPDATNDH